MQKRIRSLKFRILSFVLVVKQFRSCSSCVSLLLRVSDMKERIRTTVRRQGLPLVSQSCTKHD
jgi:hypothetical protein